MKTKLIAALLGISILGSWAQQQSEIKKLEWLLGTWETRTPKGKLYETWIKKSNSEFQAKSYYLNKKDTIMFERVQLVEKDKKLHYIVSVTGQHHEQPVDFVSTAGSNSTALVFENQQNDFPQIITYKKIAKDSLFAEISGKMNGKIAKQAFPMKKIK
ncbi:hypothetical protein C1637_14075 [Chryseobacterium lactis]|uniref:DUF6265 domain-containing protein n=1 Tax=Chryseobacterium lactis TaxID=1241981 RepID=A0A3G6RQI8_CHRLC|nr:DUF6265 family protein [Chryseobacterium lactis]AZA83751.1 hypothetical protein EG342_18490 [Chryseobacterium lactis]AZB04136.1 hypothetical protein EG341_09365 [Chryseobacterium lactis]PNW12955.1 hypothetical protein C1637_14075 [Chryseobacterium lactis]